MLYVFYGPTGCGKSTIAKLFQERCGWKPILRFTTRPMRPGEINGVDYCFVEKPWFDALRYEFDKFCQVSQYPNAMNDAVWYYGTPYDAVLDVGRASYLCCGADEVESFANLDNVALVEVQAKPSTCYKRAIERGDEPEEVVRRLLSDLDFLYDYEIDASRRYFIDTDVIHLDHPNPKAWLQLGDR